tara:strand:- start:161 stop:499 length:339 start_codon:yes stop_codon:yes gene_type:complete
MKFKHIEQNKQYKVYTGYQNSIKNLKKCSELLIKLHDKHKTELTDDIWGMILSNSNSKYISEMKNIQKVYNYKCTKSNNKWNNSINTLTNGIQKDKKDMINHSLSQFRLYAK